MRKSFCVGCKPFGIVYRFRTVGSVLFGTICRFCIFKATYPLCLRQLVAKQRIQEVILTYTARQPFRLLKEDHGVIPLAQERLATPQGQSPLPFPNSGVGSCTSHKNQIRPVGPTGAYSSLSEKVRKSYFQQMSLQRQHFLLVFSQLFKEPQCWSGRGMNPRPPAQQIRALPTKLV